MAMTLRVNPEHLAASAAQITNHAEDLAASHLSADNQIAAAQPGWTGRSAEALAHRALLWAADSKALLTRMGEHANDFYSCGQAFSATEDLNIEMLKSCGAPMW
jgi:uncharacterized protein YukE